MGKRTLALLLAGCFGLYLWAQAPQGQSAPDPTAAPEQKVADRNSAPPKAEINPAPPDGVATEIKEFPVDKFQNFSAIQNGAPVPGMESDIHIYRSGKLMRMEGSMKDPTYFITDVSIRRTHSVWARGCLKMKSAYIRSFPFFLSSVVSGPGVKFESIPLGEETLDGHHCHVEDILIHNPKNPDVLRYRFHEADDLQGFPIKIENVREHTHHWVITYRDVRLGPQDPSLFIYPEKCDSDEDMGNVGSSPKKPKKAPAAKPQ